MPFLCSTHVEPLIKLDSTAIPTPYTSAELSNDEDAIMANVQNPEKMISSLKITPEIK